MVSGKFFFCGATNPCEPQADVSESVKIFRAMPFFDRRRFLTGAGTRLLISGAIED
jgi:hypothetical protein